MTAQEAYEQAKKQWPTAEQEIKGVYSDIAYAAEKGDLKLCYDQLLCYTETISALHAAGYEYEADSNGRTCTIHWSKPRDRD